MSVPEAAHGSGIERILTMTNLILTISIVPRIWCPTRGVQDTSKYEHVLCQLVETFRLETQTPQARVFEQNTPLGFVALLLPGQQELTPLQYCWPYSHTEVTGYECRLSRAVEQEEK